ncbi:MAG: serine protease [Oscillospiraceae bacterium]
MKSAGLIKKVVGALLVLLLAFSFGIPVLAAGGVPNAVTDARSSVVRIAVMHNDYYVGSGSGFAVGRGDEIYIITNWHVTTFDEIDAKEIKFRIYFAENRYIPATLKGTSAGRDLAILEPVNPIPGLKPIALQTGEVKTGAAGYALGFPGSADDISGTFLTGEDAITITNGIVSGIRSFSIGDNSRPNTQILQTNIAISGGNSGGPLLDSGGNVIGINTLGVTTDSNLFACVHVQELVEYLDDSNIAYTTAADKVWGTALWAMLGVLIAGIAVLVVFCLKSTKNPPLLRAAKTAFPFLAWLCPAAGFI